MTRPPRRIPGVENRERRRRDGTAYWTFRVRWIDPATGKRTSEEFDDQAEAVDFKAHLRLARRTGALEHLNAGRETLLEYVPYWWDTYATHNLSRATLKAYSVMWNKHALPRLGHLELRAVTPGVIARLRTDLEQAGAGAATIRKTLSVLQAIFRRAVEEDRVAANPVAQVRKPTAVRQRAVQPLPPDVVEQIRQALAAPADQALVTVLAYAGLRPQEALALQWRHVRKQTILIEQKAVDGQIVVGQKVIGRAARTIDMLNAVRGDLAEYRFALGRPDDTELVWPRPDGKPWTEIDFRNWRKRTFRAAAAAAGLTTRRPPWNKTHPYDGPVPYDLRHSFASLLIHEGRLSVVEIAHQLGHSTETLLSTYAHVFAELRDQPKVSADAQITKARATRMRRLG